MEYFTPYEIATGEITGLISGTGLVPPSDTALTKYVNGEFHSELGYINARGEFVPYTNEQHSAKSTRPQYPARWSNITMQWEDLRTLGELQDAKWEVIKLDRASHETGTFQWNGHTIDADMARLNGAATSAMIAQAAGYTYSNVWTLADNTMIPVTGQDIFAMGLALDAHVSACHARGRALRQLIYSCTTKEEVEAITWETAV